MRSGTAAGLVTFGWVVRDSMRIHLAGLAATRSLAVALAGLLRVGGFVALSGDLGAGKTRLVREFALAAGSSDRVTSPTFAVVNEYAASMGLIRHVDAYRLADEYEAEERGLTDLLIDPDALVLCEWPERIASLIPADALWLAFSRIDDGGDGDDGDEVRGAPRSVDVSGPARLVDPLRAWAGADGGRVSS